MALETCQPEDAILVGPLDVRANATEVDEFAAALGLRLTPGSVPLTFPIRWLALPAVREAVGNATGTVYSVHASQSFEYGARIEIGRDYFLRIAIWQDRIPAPRLVVRGSVYDEDYRNVLQLETVLHPTTVLSAAMLQKQYAAGSGSLPEIDVGVVDVPQVERYATAAHDPNRLHSDADFARAVGLAGPIVHGMMMMGLFQKALSEWRAGTHVARLFTLFVRPVLIGSRLAIGGRIVSDPKAENRQIVRLFVCTEPHNVACVGEALIDLDPSSILPTL